MLAGGTENMTQAPHVLRGRARGCGSARARSRTRCGTRCATRYCGLLMAETAENLAAKYGITREAQDDYAHRSQQRADARGSRAVRGRDRAGRDQDAARASTVVDRDEHMRPDTTLEALAKLPPAFKKDGIVTAGNASGIVDGGAARGPRQRRREGEGLTPLARLVVGVVGVEPSIMGIGPAPAIRKALDDAGLTLDDIDLFEVNEAFAAQYLAVEKELGLDRDKVNVNGGAIALGHPLGATGARLC